MATTLSGPLFVFPGSEPWEGPEIQPGVKVAHFPDRIAVTQEYDQWVCHHVEACITETGKNGIPLNLIVIAKFMGVLNYFLITLPVPE